MGGTHTVKQLECQQLHAAVFASGAGISGSRTTFSWLQDVLFTHVQGVVIL